jgi:hypothetical protein
LIFGLKPISHLTVLQLANFILVVASQGVL